MAQEAITGKPGELEQPDGLGQPRIDHRGVPGRGPREDPASLGRLGAGGDPVGVRRRRLSGRPAPARADGQRGHPGAGPSRALEKLTSRHIAPERGLVRIGGGHSGSPSCPDNPTKERTYGPRAAGNDRAREAATVPHATGEVKRTRSRLRRQARKFSDCMF